MSEFIKVQKGDEIIDVHPDALADHKRLGWNEVVVEAVPEVKPEAKAKAAEKKAKAEAEAVDKEP